jgi:hypothetical protein
MWNISDVWIYNIPYALGRIPETKEIKKDNRQRYDEDLESALRLNSVTHKNIIIYSQS